MSRLLILVGLVALVIATYWQLGLKSTGLPTPNPAVEATTDELSLVSFAKRKFTGTDFTVGRVLEKNANYTRYFITYKSEGLTISGIMNVPKGEGPYPVLILNHGHIDTSVYTNGRGLRREQDFFARNGYVVVHPDYRNHAKSDKDETTDGGDFRFGYTTDVINVINALKASKLSYIDTERVGMLGHSMGGGITMNILVTQPRLVDAAVLYAPVSADVRDNFNKWTRPRTAISQPILEKYGEPEENPKFWDNLSPVNFVSNIVAPIEIYHGTADKDTDLAWSQRFEAAVKDAGKEIALHTYAGQPHEFTTSWSDFMHGSLAFFDLHLAGR